MNPTTVVLSTLVVLFTSLLSSSDAWFFFRGYPSAKAKGAEISEECMSLAKKGSCAFYSCFEERLPCGKNWYNVKYGEPYCVDFKAFHYTFSQEGQKFLDDAQQCMGQELLTWYTRDSMNCHDYTHFAFKAMSRCYIKHGFCDVIKSDVMNFATVYNPKHLFSRGALKIWKEIVRIAYHCDPQGFQDVIVTLFESIKD